MARGGGAGKSHFYLNKDGGRRNGNMELVKVDWEGGGLGNHISSRTKMEDEELETLERKIGRGAEKSLYMVRPYLSSFKKW